MPVEHGDRLAGVGHGTVGSGTNVCDGLLQPVDHRRGGFRQLLEFAGEGADACGLVRDRGFQHVAEPADLCIDHVFEAAGHDARQVGE